MLLVFGSMIWMKGAYISYFEETKKKGCGVGWGGEGGEEREAKQVKKFWQ
jgi:hypothetical protein